MYDDCVVLNGCKLYQSSVWSDSLLLCYMFPAKIQSMKNAVPKNDKKRRKQLTEEIAKLETDLSQKHEEELKQLEATTVTKVNACIQMIVKCCCHVLEISWGFKRIQHNQSSSHSDWQGGRSDKWSGDHEGGWWKPRRGQTTAYDQSPEKKGDLLSPLQIAVLGLVCLFVIYLHCQRTNEVRQSSILIY